MPKLKKLGFFSLPTATSHDGRLARSAPLGLVMSFLWLGTDTCSPEGLEGLILPNYAPGGHGGDGFLD